MTGFARDLTAYELAVNLPYAIVFAAVAVEVAWLAAPPLTRSAVLRRTRIAATMALVAFAVSAGYTVVLRALWHFVGAAAPDALVTLWQRHALLGAATAFVAWDAVGWLYHWVGHRTRIGWAAHQPHHSGDTFDITLGLRQSWAPFHGLLYQPLLALAGFDFRVIAVCAAVSNCWQVLQHTSAPVALPRWLTATVMTPAAHRHHHGSDVALVNLGPVLTWWDRLAGTWVPQATAPPVSYGIGSAATGALAIELAGWRALLASPRE